MSVHPLERQTGLPGLGPLATLIQEEVVLGPVRFPGYLALLEKIEASQTKQDNAKHAYTPSPGDHSHAWLRARGRMATLIRDCYRQDERLRPNPTTRTQALLLARTIHWLTLDDFYFANILLDGIDHEHSQFAANNQILSPEWARAWILSGILELADKLLRPSYNRITHSMFEASQDDQESPPLRRLQERLQDYHPRDFRLLGQHLLFISLRNRYQYGGPLPEKFDTNTKWIETRPKHFGIPPRGHLLNDELRLIAGDPTAAED